MSAPDSISPEPTARTLHGPRAWTLSALIGLVLGVLPGLFVPHPSDAPELSLYAEPRAILQTRSDGSRWQRRPDGTETPYTGTTATPAQSPPPVHAATPPLVSAQPQAAETIHYAPLRVPLWLCTPFALLLASIALVPFVNERFWHRRYPDFAFLLGSVILGYYLAAFGAAGRETLLHVGLEYYSFIALVGGLYVASGGILVDARDRGTPWRNTALLGVGALLANLAGTTGASMLLIRPYLRMNQGRLRPPHVVFFIFIVANCGGCLTPIGDPPLYLGFLKGVPFFWTLTHLWPMWLLVNGLLLAMFFVYDTRVPPAGPAVLEGEARPRVFDPSHRTPLIAGWPALGCLVLLVGGVFIDPLLKAYAGVEGVPAGATFQVAMAALAYRITRPSVRHSNAFTFAPVKEVGFLFAGIFLTMTPALAYLAANAGRMGLESPTHFYYGTGLLSSALDNAPTYLSFLQINFGVVHLPLTPDGVHDFIGSTFDILHAPGGDAVHYNGQSLLESISLGAVFFGALTYIGNGPNFMLKSIVDASRREHGVRMPSFFGYLAMAVTLLLPVLVINWLVFIRG